MLGISSEWMETESETQNKLLEIKETVTVIEFIHVITLSYERTASYHHSYVIKPQIFAHEHQRPKINEYGYMYDHQIKI